MRMYLFFLLLLNIFSCGKGEADAMTDNGADIPSYDKYDIIVAKDGSGDVNDLQAAFDRVPANSAKQTRIFVKKGVYRQVVRLEKNKVNVRLTGEEAATTILTFDNYSGKDNGNGGTHSTSTSSSVYINGNNFIAENITFENSAGPVGQALAIYINAANSAFFKCRFLGNQDTYYAHENTRQYLKECYIAGTVDFIFGGSVAFFENCQLHSLAAGYLTAASTPQGTAYGYVFNNCRLTAPPNPDFSVYLGRPWRPYAKVVFLSCEMPAHIRPEGWSIWKGNDNHLSAYYAEYKSSGAGGSGSGRVSWSKQLNDSQADNYTIDKVLTNWTLKF